MSGPTAEQIGLWLRKARQRARARARKQGRRDFSVEKVARHVNVGEKTVRLWEKGVNPPPADKFFALIWHYRTSDITALLPRKAALDLEGAAIAADQLTQSNEDQDKKRRPA